MFFVFKIPAIQNDHVKLRVCFDGLNIRSHNNPLIASFTITPVERTFGFQLTALATVSASLQLSLQRYLLG